MQPTGRSLPTPDLISQSNDPQQILEQMPITFNERLNNFSIRKISMTIINKITKQLLKHLVMTLI